MTEHDAHDELSDALAEFATGAASGADRARVLRQVGGCADCREELASLSAVADEVLLIAPERQPAAGFESAVLDRIAALEPAKPAPARRPKRRRVYRALAAATAAVLIAAGAALGVWWATAPDRELAASYRETLGVADGRYFTAAPVVDAEGGQVGHVFAYQGDPSWVFAVLDGAPEDGTWDVVAVTGEGTDAIATCEVADASCGAGATVDADIYDLHEVELVAPDGTVLTATFTH
ncbi:MULTISPECIES: hypothetical protein [Glycomyces]|uniref:Zinc-finger domain-containing protein n=2 Tax=Glycomyces TaxID=58113 RepID=A0A9X3T741_9ACTN|nr:hypothetical protein [Glycomyces lechevalierae]MDA1383803.1 hypothetical protein [Glycomyces lechevalierae]MDR7341204.1 hypothetical protein [Glycomyces lechevalierae]